MDSNEGVLLPWIHEHLMVPWNDLRKGDCCGGFETISDGYYCENCKFFVHKKCSEFSQYIEHPSHPGHTLGLRIHPNNSCSLCGKELENLFYCCEICDFNMDLYCTKYPPPKFIEVSKTHQHELTLYKKKLGFYCDANCGKKTGEDKFSYDCDECDLSFHVNCVWHPLEDKPVEYITIEIGNKLSLPFIHEHLMVPWNDMRKGSCCGRFESMSDGFYCESCDFFVHKECSESRKYIKPPSHFVHPLRLRPKLSLPLWYISPVCDLSGKHILNLLYHCETCNFDMDLYYAKYPPPEVIEVLETHEHKINLFKEKIEFDCDANCGKIGDGFPYKCHECDKTFHVDCVWNQGEVERPLEVNHSYHSLHPLKLFIGQPPVYSDGRCRLCGRTIDDRLFYHCSSCNFTLDMHCVLNPPPKSIMDLKAHDHQLTLLPRLDSFTCNACGLKGDRSPYVCFQCGFMIHRDCLELPRVININRHDHRISRTSVLGVVNYVCGVCRKKVDWTCGGCSCKRCPGYVVHSKCATRKDVWNGKELEGVPEEIEDIEPYVVIDENTIQHFSHKEHYLRLHVNGVLYEESTWCKACSHPIGHQSFYGCIDCDFLLHQNCAELRKKKWHVLHNEQLTLLTTSKDDYFECDACGAICNGFVYKQGKTVLDVRCASISEPFVHPSHSHHPLYYIPRDRKETCNGCNMKEPHVLRCIEDGCEFVLGFKCATLPQVVKNRVDDHPLSLSYGEEASGKYWCDICEKETNPKTWFYTCKDHRASFHTMCVLGDFAGLMPRSTIDLLSYIYEVVLNNSVTRPFCMECESRCLYPIILKMLQTSDTICSLNCR